MGGSSSALEETLFQSSLTCNILVIFGTFFKLIFLKIGYIEKWLKGAKGVQ